MLLTSFHFYNKTIETKTETTKPMPTVRLMLFSLGLSPQHSGLMVSVLDSGSSGPGSGSGPGRAQSVVFLGKKLYSHGALFTQVHEWVTAKMPGVTLRWTSIPSRGEQKYS